MKSRRLMSIAALAIVALISLALLAARRPPELKSQRGRQALRATHFPVSTRNAPAQAAFDQGMKWLYAFNHDEAISAFQKASTLDPKLAMAHWGTALALGPNINLDVDPDREKQAYEETQKALALLGQASAREKGYVQALTRRYSVAPGADLKKLADDYSAAMHSLMKSYPDDLDAATLWAESAMDLRPWKLWNPDGSPAPGTTEIVSVLESVLKRNPNHLGANHYYIHTVEASAHPEKALASARVIPSLAPDAGHLVHMPAHILMRTGDYAGASLANEKAAAVDRTYIARHGSQGIYPLMYYNHNLDFLAAARSMEGRYADAKKAADMLHDNVAAAMTQMPEMAGMFESFLTRPTAMLIRFGRWDDVLALPLPPKEHPIELTFIHFARGLALAAKGDDVAAAKEETSFGEGRKTIPADAMWGLNPVSAVLDVAGELLHGRVARAAGDHAAEVAALERAVAAEDLLAYDEPSDFFYPVRESLGAALLRAGRTAQAAQAFRDDLARNPDNPRSLLGLSESLRLVNPAEAERLRVKQQAGWKTSDVRLSLDDL